MKKLFVSLTTLALPALASAQVFVGSGTNLDTLIRKFIGLLRIVVPILITFAVIYLILNAIKFMTSEGETKENAKKHLVNSLIGLFVILAFFGIIIFISNTLGIGIGGGIQSQYQPNVYIPQY